MNHGTRRLSGQYLRREMGPIEIRASLRGGLGLFAALATALSFASIATADVPIRVSIKFIVDVSGNRPATGNFNTTAEVNAEADAGNGILKDMISEHRILITEILDLPISLSGWSNTSVNESNKDLIRATAMTSPATWSWRTNAVNVYVTGGSGSAYSSFPPINDVILFGQNCGNSPSCLLHELGHSINLLHTHQGGGADGCSDTLLDNSGWTSTNQMAQANYGLNYSQLSGSQQNLVDQTWSNFMSYHTSPPQLRYSPCQKDRASNQMWTDRATLLSKQPVYVGFCIILCVGSFTFPYPTIQDALNAGVTGKVIVLDDIDTNISQTSINLSTEIVTRQGTSHVDRGVLNYELPVNMDEEPNPTVGSSVKAAQDKFSEGRRVLSAAKNDVQSMTASPSRTAVLNSAKDLDKQHRDSAMKYLLEAELRASGNHKLALQMELAQRYWHREEYERCLAFYTLVADATDQPHLREKALMHAGQCQSAFVKSTTAAAVAGPEDQGETEDELDPAEE